MSRRALLKDRIRQQRAFYALWRRVRAFQMERGLARVARHYAGKVAAQGGDAGEQAVCAAVAGRLAARGIARTHDRRPLRMFWVGANWPQDSSGFLDGLNAFGDVVVFRNASGSYGQRFTSSDGATRLYDPEVVAENDACLEQQIDEALRKGPIDVLIGQMWANFLSVGVLRRIQARGIVTLNIAMDDRLPEHWKTYRNVRLGSVGLGEGLDLVLTSSRECCAWYLSEGVPAIFWPMASDPRRFRPLPEREKRYDVSFIGNKYGLRARIVAGLERRGIRVDCFGAGWPNGSADADRSADVFARSRIILGVGNVGYSEKVLTLKLRDFDATMAGALYLTHRNPGLLELFDEGVEIECYASIDECARKIRFYLDHPAERAKVAAAAAARARQEHTWQIRVFRALSSVGFADVAVPCSVRQDRQQQGFEEG